MHKQARSGNLTVSDRIDRIVTNRILALPIFVVVMGVIYSIAMGQLPISIGTKGTDWANDVLFGEIVPGLFDKLLLNAQGEPVVAHWLYGLIQDGIVAGVGLCWDSCLRSWCSASCWRFWKMWAIWPCGVCHGPHLPPLRTLRQKLHSASGGHRMRCARYHVHPDH